MDVQIITIGDELLIGQVIDTNSAWMGQQLEKEGFRVVGKTAVGDVEKDILNAVNSAMQRARIVLVTGGIGPTKDDITKKTLCNYFDSGIHFSEEVYENIKLIFNRSGRLINELTRDQAMVPDKAVIIQNKAGTAPCTWFEQEGKILVSMPGVPYEMKWLMTNEIIPRLREKFLQDIYIKHQTTWVTGFGESDLAIKLTSFENELPPFIKLAYLPQPGIIRLRLSAYAEDPDLAEKSIAEQRKKLHDILDNHILTDEDKPLELQVADSLIIRGMTMGTAESCTGGRIASLITTHPGSSKTFVGSIVSYSNDVKKNILRVSEDDLNRFGAVSKPVVEQMVSGAIKVLNCDYAVATSGIAGPDGATPEKPVGTVWIAAASKEKVVSECYQFSNLRELNIMRASNMALLMLLKLINSK